jgi:hypothetical protein
MLRVAGAGDPPGGGYAPALGGVVNCFSCETIKKALLHLQNPAKK